MRDRAPNHQGVKSPYGVWGAAGTRSSSEQKEL